MRLRLVGRLAGALSLLVALILCSAPAAAADMKAAVAATGTPGVFEFLFEGYRPFEPVSTWLTGPSQQVIAGDSLGSDRDGTVWFQRRIPRHYEPGRWAMTIAGHASGRLAVGYFDLAPRGPDVSLEVSQPSASPGATLVFGSAQFEPNEIVSYWATGPDGKGYDGGYVVADESNGRVAFSYAIPAGAPTGAWTMSAYGETSDRLGVAVFTVG